MDQPAFAMLTRVEIDRLPKVELHVHLDCSLSFDLVSKLLPGIPREEFRRRFVAPPRCNGLPAFLRAIDASLELLQTAENLRAAADDLCRQLQRDNVFYAEIRFAPLLHQQRGLSAESVVATVAEALESAVAKSGIEARIILCDLRHFDGKQSDALARLLDRFAGTRVVGLDLAGDEANFPLAPHIPAFAHARARNYFRTAHAGEAAGAESIRETLAGLAPTRIGHGVRCSEDENLVRRLREERIHLEVCPTCNIQTGVFPAYENHSVDFLFRQGISLGINTDARTVSDVTLGDEYWKLQRSFGWGRGHFYRCNRDALDAAFLPLATRKELQRQLAKGYSPGGTGVPESSPELAAHDAPIGDN